MIEATPPAADAAEKGLLTRRYADRILGPLGCWDRVIITGTLTDVCHAGAVEAWLRRDQIRCFDLKVFAEPLRDQVRDHALLTARAAGLTIEHVERKNFRQEDRVAEVLQKRGDAPGLARAFYALGDVKTPMRISLFCFAVNLIFAVALVRPLRQGGLGIANTVTSLCNVGLLFYALRRKLGKLGMESLRATLLPLAGAGILAGLAAWWGCRLWENTIGHAALFQKVGAVFVPAAAAGLIYFLATVALKIPAAKEMADLVFQIFRGQQQQ